jgi:sugar transferase (PEP-CTERM/EpsH1 system associated)
MESKPAPERPLVLHVVYRLAVGGTENGIVNLINHLPTADFRHAVVALDAIDAEFVRRLQVRDVDLEELHKAPGHGYRIYSNAYRLFRRLRPAIVHTRSLAGLELMVPAWLARVPVRIHGEHGWEINDPDGRNRAYRWLRRAHRPFVHRYVAVSRRLVAYLERLGVAPARVEQIYNGVDLARYHPAAQGRSPIAGCPFVEPRHWLVGTVGRMQPVKDQLNLAHAFVEALRRDPSARSKLRLVLVGDGPLVRHIEQFLTAGGVRDLVWIPGQRNDIPEVMRGLDCFVLPSIAEGISNTILEAMASGLPVIATDVGGNAELIDDGVTGDLIPAGEPGRLADAVLQLARDPKRAVAYGAAGRARAENEFALDTMVRRYHRLYTDALAHAGHGARAPVDLRPVRSAPTRPGVER